MKPQIRHETIYRYDAPGVTDAVPAADAARHRAPEGAAMEVDAGGASAHARRLRQRAARAHTRHPRSEICIRARAWWDVTGGGRAFRFHRLPLSPLLFLCATALTRRGQARRSSTRSGANRTRFAGLRDLAAAIREKMPFECMNCPSRRAPRRFAVRSGADPTWPMFIACTRQLGVPSRYVSGYLARESPRASRPSAGWKPDR